MINPLKYEKNLWNKGIELIAGVDEAGRGPLAGPIVIASVILNKTDLLLLQEEIEKEAKEKITSSVSSKNPRNNDLSTEENKKPYHLINDSKKISEKKREFLYDFIKSEAICYSIVEISVEEIAVSYTHLTLPTKRIV